MKTIQYYAVLTFTICYLHIFDFNYQTLYIIKNNSRQVMSNKIPRQQNRGNNSKSRSPFTETIQVSNVLQNINSNTLWKNKSVKLNKSITLGKTQKKQKNNNLMTEQDLQRLFVQNIKTQCLMSKNWGNRNIKDFVNSVKFLKISDKQDKLLTGVPKNIQQDYNLIQSLYSNQSQNLTKQFKNDYLVGRIVGEGAYASVRVAIYKPLNVKVAIKVYQKSKIQQIQKKKFVRRQIKILQMIIHPQIVQIIDVVQTNHHLNIIMEYLPGISLNSYLKAQFNGKATEKNGKKIIKCLAQALKYIHQKHISHRDIKLQNVIVNDQLIPKLIDFGFSTCISSPKKVKIFCGTPSYMAPQIVQKKQYKGEPADIWALGVLSYVVVTGSFPFKGSTDQQLYKKINNAEYSKTELYSKELLDLMSKMLQVNPTERIIASQILNHPWIYEGNNKIIKNTTRLETSCQYRKKTTTSFQKIQPQQNFKKLKQNYKQNVKLQFKVNRNSNQKLNKTSCSLRKISKDKTKAVSNFNPLLKKQYLNKTTTKVLDLLKMQVKMITQSKSKGKNRRI